MEPRIRIRWGMIGFLLWLAGSAAAYAATFSRIVTEPVELQLSDGTPVCGTLYHSNKCDERKPGVVVLHGAALSHRSCAPGLSTPLARKGYIVLAIDLIGHGHSGGSRPRSEYGKLEGILSVRAEHPEVEAAIAYLQGHPLVDGRHIALVGHSRGGWAAANVARRRNDVGSVVTIGIAPPGCDGLRPHNLFLLTGDHDPFAPADLAAQAIAEATGGQLQQSHSSSGDFAAGTARRWVMLPGAFHLSALADPAVSRYTLGWLGFSFQRDSGELSGNRLLVAIFGAVVATVGGVLLCWQLLAFAAGILLPPLRRGGRGGSQNLTRGGGSKACRASLVLRPFLVLGSMLFAAPFTGWLSAGFEVGPLQFAAPTVLLASCAGLIVFATSVPGRRFDVTSNTPLLGKIAPAAGLGLVSFVLSFVTLAIAWGPTWADLLPTPQRLACGLCLLLLLFPACLLLARGMERITPGPDTTLRTLSRGLLWLLTGAAIWLGFELFLLERWPLFSVPVWLLGMSLLVPLPLWLLPNRPGMTLARTLSHTVGAAWLLACHLPFSHAG
jgi:pimeloyl-ACP methyl ester carboxylesterase